MSFPLDWSVKQASSTLKVFCKIQTYVHDQSKIKKGIKKKAKKKREQSKNLFNILIIDTFTLSTHKITYISKGSTCTRSQKQQENINQNLYKCKY